MPNAHDVAVPGQRADADGTVGLLTMLCWWLLCVCVSSDGSEHRWLQESHFQRDLVRDNIENAVLHEELRAVRSDHTALT